MKNVFYFILTMLFISCAGTSKFVEMEDYSELNGEYYAYSVEENNPKGSNIASFFSEGIDKPTTFTLQATTDSLYISYHYNKEGKTFKKTFPIQGKRKKRFIKDNRRFLIIPFYPIFARVDIQTLRFGKDKEGNFLVHQYYDNTGAILFVGAGHSGKHIDVYQKLKKYSHPYFYAKQGKYGLINAQGDTLKPPIFNEYLPFSDGVAKIEVENKKGVIGEMGNVIIPAEYDFLEQGWKQSSDTYYASRVGNFGILDKEGRELVPFVYENIAPHYDFFYKLYKNNKVGIYIPKTNIHIPAIYDELKSENTEYQRFLVFKDEMPYIVDYYGYEYEVYYEEYLNFSVVPKPHRKEAVYFENKYYFPKLETGKKVIFYNEENKE